MSDPAIQAEGLTKTVGWWSPQVLVEHLDLSVLPGQIFGLLGPNGAGKTTAFKLLLGLARISSGKASLFGRPVPTPESRRGVGFLPEVVNHPEILTIREYLSFHARLLGLNDSEIRINGLLQQFSLAEAADRALGLCSKGMRQRVDIARVLLADARLILLDEPVSGLDPLGQRLLKDLLLRLKSEGISILLNSHAVGILSEVCDAVGIMHRGRLMLQGSLAGLLAAVRTRIRFRLPAGRTLPAPPPATETAQPSPGVTDWVLVSGPAVPAGVAAVVQAGGEVSEVTPLAGNLEEVFTRVIREREPGRNPTDVHAVVAPGGVA